MTWTLGFFSHNDLLRLSLHFHAVQLNLFHMFQLNFQSSVLLPEKRVGGATENGIYQNDAREAM